MYDDGDVIVRPGAKLLGHHVRAKKGGNEIDGMLRVEPADRAQLPQFRFHSQAISALRFARRCPAGRHLVEPHTRQRNEFVFRRRTGCRHGPRYATPCGCDLGVCRTRKPLLQLLAPVARVYDMGVGIDETGDDGTTACVNTDCRV